MSVLAGFPEQNLMAPATLHLTTVGEQFDPSHDAVLGPHCFMGREGDFPGWQDLTFVEAFPDERSLEIAEQNIRGLANHLLPALAQRLNAYHKCEFSIDFWRILILPWLVEIAQRAWVSFSKLQALRDQCGSLPLNVKVYRGDADWLIEDTAQLLQKLLKDYRFNWWIDSEIAAALAPPGWRFLPSEPVSSPVTTTNSQAASQHGGMLRSGLRNIKYCLGYTDILGIRWGGLLLAAYVNLLPKSPSRVHFRPSLDFKPEQHFPPAFLKALDRLLDATMPRSFLEGFPELLRKARRLPYCPGRLRLGTLSFWNEQEKVISALAKENGEKRVVAQHGGEYGMLKYNIMANEMELRSSIFISWGWTCGQPDDGYILPLPSPYHSKIANTHKRRNDSVIVVGQSVRIHLNRLHWSCRSSLPLWYCKDVVHFIKSLGQETRRNVIFRPHSRVANDIEVRDVVGENFPDIPMLETDLNAALLKCRLAVMNTFSTTINYTMAANVPTVVYMPPSIMAPRKEAEPYFEPLRRCGVIHESAEDAAAHINAIWGDVEGWWLSDEVQEARKIWVEQYARTDRFWWWQWMKALAKLKDVG